MMAFSWGYTNYRKLSKEEATIKIIEREENRHVFYTMLLKLVYVVTAKKARMIIENPYSMQHFLKQGNFVKSPAFVDNDRTLRGDFFRKPTSGCSYQQTPPEKIKNVIGGQELGGSARGSAQAGLCSEERSMISPDYARNFICDFILGKAQNLKGMQLSLF